MNDFYTPKNNRGYTNPIIKLKLWDSFIQVIYLDFVQIKVKNILWNDLSI